MAAGIQLIVNDLEEPQMEEKTQKMNYGVNSYVEFLNEPRGTEQK